MKEIIIFSKFEYWLGVFTFGSLSIFSLVMFEMIDLSIPDGRILFYILLIFSTIVFLKTFNFFSRDVYALIDLERNQFIYGNAFFNKKANMTNVKFIKKVLLKKAMIIEISGRRHRMLISNRNQFDEIYKCFSH